MGSDIIAGDLSGVDAGTLVFEIVWFTVPCAVGGIAMWFAVVGRERFTVERFRAA